MIKKIIITLMMVFGLMSCGKPEVEQDFDNLIKALKTNDFNEYKKYDADVPYEMVKLFGNGYKDLNYKVEKVLEGYDEATLEVTIEYPDLSDYITEYMFKIVSISFNAIGKNDEESEKIFFEETAKFINEKLEENTKMQKEDIKVYYIKKDGKWMFDPEKNQDFLNVISFNFLKGTNGILK